MNSFVIKLIAVTTMFIDHIGLFFFPHILLLRIIGRLSFPLFAWLIANGAIYSHNIFAYVRRIFIFGCISQIPFYYANHFYNHSFWELNVLFTLFLGLLAIIVLKGQKLWWIKFTGILFFSLLGYLLNTDYGAIGVLSVVFFYIYFNNISATSISQTILLAGPVCVKYIFFFVFHQPVVFTIFDYVEPIGLFSLFFIASYSHQQGPKQTKVFYYLYPIQYGIIFLLEVILLR